ncbi:MAG: hypothetical protein IT337_00510 [Thermomicrobiales bacterium]|nr:hypothetical protein [Thermomicrobiales bacterium]
MRSLRSSISSRRAAITRRALLQGSLGAAGLALVGCSGSAVFNGGGSSGAYDMVAWPGQDKWPQMFWDAPTSVQETYRYAVANQDLLQWMPCFCGCVDQGHVSNADCYVEEMRDDGSVLLDPMSFG